jgi:hypothetical protein
MLGGKHMKFLAVVATISYGEDKKRTTVLYVSTEDGRVYFLKPENSTDEVPESIKDCHIHKCIGEFVTNKNNSATYFVQLNTSFTVDTLKDLFINVNK